MNEIRTGEEQERDSQGRFVPGTSGNIAGRPAGVKDRRAKRREELFGPILPDAIEKLRQAVSDGERWAVELVVTLPDTETQTCRS